MTTALMALPSGVWFSRFRPVPLVLASLLLSTPFLFPQELTWHFLVLLMARLCLAFFHEIATPARLLLLQPWVAPRHYALVHAVGLSQHSILMATAISTSAWLIVAVGSCVWPTISRAVFWWHRHSPGCSSPVRARRLYPRRICSGPCRPRKRLRSELCGLTHRASSWGSPCSPLQPPGRPW
jgi:hypothetical protein